MKYRKKNTYLVYIMSYFHTNIKVDLNFSASIVLLLYATNFHWTESTDRHEDKDKVSILCIINAIN